MALVNRENQLLANGFYYRLNENGEAIICGAEVWPEVLIIPETLDGHTVVEIGDGAFDTDNAVDSVLLTDGPVSYTHLDVYKRQAPSRFRTWRPDGMDEPVRKYRFCTVRPGRACLHTQVEFCSPVKRWACRQAHPQSV